MENLYRYAPTTYPSSGIFPRQFHHPFVHVYFPHLLFYFGRMEQTTVLLSTSGEGVVVDIDYRRSV